MKQLVQVHTMMEVGDVVSRAQCTVGYGLATEDCVIWEFTGSSGKIEILIPERFYEEVRSVILASGNNQRQIGKKGGK